MIQIRIIYDTQHAHARTVMYREQKLNVLFKKLIAEFFSRHLRDSIITITDCVVSPDLKQANVFVSVYPDTEQEKVLGMMRREKKNVHAFLKRHTRVKTLPRLRFRSDMGESRRVHMEKILGNP